MEQEHKCLFCNTSIKISKNLSEDWDQERKKKSKILTAIFTKLCLLFHLDFPNKWSWDFKEEPFPFCKSCRKEISVLCKLHDQISIIQKQISKIVAKLSGHTIEYHGKECKPKERNNAENVVNESGDTRLVGNKAGNKYEYFRREIISRYSPNLVLEDCKSGLTRSESLTAVVDVPEDRLDGDVPKDGNGIRICEDIFETSSSCEAEADGQLDPPISIASPREGESVPVSPAGSLRVEDTTIGTGMLSVHKELKPDVPEDMRSLPPEKPKRHVYPVSSQNECETNTVCLETSSKIPQTSSSGRKAKSRAVNVIRPYEKVELVEGNEYMYHGFRFIADKHQASCLKCAYKAIPGKGKKDAYSRIKMHIRRHVAGMEGAPRDDFSGYKIKLVDEATKTYTVGGFEFTEDGNNYYRCSTCNQLSSRNWTRRKYFNIKTHIKNVHMETRSGICSVCKEYKKNLPKHFKNIHSQTSNKRVCETCGKEFRNLLCLTQHRRSHKDPSEFKHQCDRCGKKFRGKDQLICHMRTHTGEKPFVCEKCGRQFAFRGVYQTHLASHEKVRPFACTQCEWTFGANFLLTRHIKQVHQGIKPPPARKRKKVVPDDDKASSSCSSSE